MSNRIKSIAKKILPNNLTSFLAGILNRDSSPYSLKSIFYLPQSISDFFIWDSNCFKIDFIAENTRAILSGKKIRVTHCFRFYSAEGTLEHEEFHKGDDFFTRVRLNGPKNISGYTSFTHHVDSEIYLHKIIDSSFSKMSFCEQNRGYTIYYRNAGDAIGSVVHGNFGGISNQGYTLARKRSEHLYTPAYQFKQGNEYDLVFNNPTQSNLQIIVIFNNGDNREVVEIKSLGTGSLRISNYSGSLTFESKLPICRAVIFRNTRNQKHSNFDVLHS